MMLRAIAAFALALAAITAADPAYIKDVEAWRAKHEADYRRDWASIDGLFFLKPGENRAGSARTNSIVLSAAVPPSIGSFFLKNGKVRFEPHAGVAISRKDQPVTAPLDLIPDSGKEPADELVVNGVRIVVHGSGDRLAIRVRDANGAMARAFLGFRWFPIDERYRVTARFIKEPATPRGAREGDPEHARRRGHLYDRRRGGVLVERPDAPDAADDGEAEALLFRLQGRVERARNVRGGAVPVLGSSRRWHDGARLQRGLQSAVRVQSVHDLSGPAEGKPAEDQDSRRRTSVPTRAQGPHTLV